MSNNKNRILKHHKTVPEMKVASWNIRTLLPDTKTAASRPERRTALIASELGRLGIDIACLSETRLADEGRIDEVGSGYSFFWKGVDEGEHRRAGVGFAIKSDFVRNLSELPTGVSKRVITLRIPLHCGRYATIISAYAPILKSTDEDKGIFYDELRSVLFRVPAEDKIWLCGDFNARVGNDHESWAPLGKHGIGKSNDNGLLLLHLCTEFNLVIGNSLFQQSDHKKVTWMHPRSKQWHLLDYIIVRKRDRQDLRLVSVCRSAECWTDHRLVRAKLRLKIRRKVRSGVSSVPRRIDVGRLADLDTRKLFSDTLTASLNGVQGWDNFRDTIFSVGKETLGFRKRNHKDWFDDNNLEIQKLLAEKRHFENLVLSEDSKFNRANLKYVKHKVQKCLRSMENSWWENITNEIENASNAGETHALYSLLRKMYGPRSSTVTPVRSKDGSYLIKDQKGILGRWKEHFNDLLNCESLIDQSFIDKISQKDIKWILNDRPAFDEVKEAIDKLKLGKAPGKDGIAPEMLKYGGEAVRFSVWEIIGAFWEDESVHQDWRDAIMIVLYKSKGKRDICGNYRGIALLCVVGKVLSRIMLTRVINHIANVVLQESQCGFRTGRGTADMIFSARQLQEKCKEQRVGLYHVFIDLTKAFDTVNRTALWQILRKFGCPDKFTNILKSFHDDMKVWVALSGDLSDPISVENGVKQGDIPAPTLFAIYFYVVFFLAFSNDDAPAVYIRYRTTNKLFDLKRFNAKSKCVITAIRDLLYADDCDLVSHTEEDMQKILDLFSKACSDLGLTISLDKTKVIYSPPPGEPYIEPNLFVYGKRLSVVLEFIYLGSKLHQSCSLDHETTYRISRASASFANLRERCWSRKGISLKTKVDVYNVVVLKALTFSLETGTLYSKNISQLERFQQFCLREILNIRWQDRVTNEEVLHRCGCVSISSLLAKSQLSWSGHVVRMEDTRIPKQLLYGELCVGSRAQGGQRLRYKDTLRHNLKKCKIGVDWEAQAQDRTGWRNLVKDSVKQFESTRVGRAELKRATRKGQYHPLLADATTFPCEICPRVFLARSGLVVHMKWHKKRDQNEQPPQNLSITCHDFQKCNCQACVAIRHRFHPTSVLVREAVPVHDVMRCNCADCTNSRSMLVPPNKCNICGKVCKSKGGLTLHQKVHF